MCNAVSVQAGRRLHRIPQHPRVWSRREQHGEYPARHDGKKRKPTIAPYARTSECFARVTAKADTPAECEKMLDPVVDEILKLLGDDVYGVDVDSLEQVVGDGLRERKLTLAVAESCTGGLLSQKITAVPGASQMFALGICTYTNEMKTAILHVPESTLHTYTAVSPQTAIAMANGVAALSYADLALSVTGYAGPGGGTSEHPVGTVFLGVAYHGTAFAVHLPFDRMGVSTREGVRQGTAVCAFGIAREILMEESVCRNI